MRRLLAALITASCVIAAPTLAPAQTTPQTAPQADPGVASEDCRVAPDEEAPAPSGGDLSKKLDGCNGVLQPPPTGDTEIGQPPPDTGETPVIPPGALPEQPPPRLLPGRGGRQQFGASESGQRKSPPGEEVRRA